MDKKRPRRASVRWLACTLIATTTMAATLPPQGWAMLAPAEIPASAGYDRAADMRTVSAALESKVVRERLRDLGLDEREIDSRLSRLSDSEVHQLATHIEAVNPGGDAVIWVLTVAVLVALLIFLIQRLK